MESAPPTEAGPSEPPEPYEAPAVAWEEPYDPVGLAITCADREGNPGCKTLYEL